MILATLLYLLAASFVIWVWSPPALPRLIIMIVLIILYWATSKRMSHNGKK